MKKSAGRIINPVWRNVLIWQQTTIRETNVLFSSNELVGVFAGSIFMAEKPLNPR
ncbi:MAG TPA: hypothetical protein VFA77_09970 [Candidatus Eisenbacteria bacterium]|jgi:hypothetical protein|nr:hypothetical protein [Candidatus Eisenbacteria bacterium]